MRLNFFTLIKQSHIISTKFIRNLNTKSVRVRFAPSPTGYLHLGGLRTALYNYLFAKSHNGIFILRIEDTDQSRKVEGSVDALIRDLEWTGVEYLEGPGKGGDFGPYAQSERLHLYQQHLQTLLNNGSAYHCFCTERRLNLLRREAMKVQQVPKYDNKCRNLTKDEVKNNLRAGKASCIRFKLTSECQVFEDLIFGNIAYDVSLNEGDPVIMKSDGFPTYHFANVVDDHLMEITHVLRGVEWQISTTKHLLLYRALNWTPPQFGHLPLIVNSDGTKLSKRQSDVKVEDYRNKGIYPLALVNYITLAGGGFNHVLGEGIKLNSMDDLAEQFNIKNVSSHPSRLNPDLLEECNRLEIKRQLKHNDTQIINQLQNLIKNKFPNLNININEDYIRNVLNWSVSRITRLEDLVSPKLSFLWVRPDKQEIDTKLISNLLNELEKHKHFDECSLKSFLREFSSVNGVKFPELMKVLRSILSGLNEGPGVAEMMEILGRDQTLIRFREVLR